MCLLSYVTGSWGEYGGKVPSDLPVRVVPSEGVVVDAIGPLRVAFKSVHVAISRTYLRKLLAAVSDAVHWALVAGIFGWGLEGDHPNSSWEGRRRLARTGIEQSCDDQAFQ